MTQSLTINGKEYVPSNTLATRFKYTPDYIAKLAREEKILATQVGRQWFVEPGSLETFLHQAQVEKEIRAEELRKRRKVEHALHQQKQVSAQTVGSPLEAVAQTAIVVVCGLLLGGIGSVIVEEDLSIQEIASGVQIGVELMVAGFYGDLPHARQYQLVASPLASVSEVTAPQKPEEELRFTQLPQFPERLPVTASSTSLDQRMQTNSTTRCSAMTGQVMCPPVRWLR